MAMEPNIPEAAEAALRQSWEVHRQAFGPILEPAFTELPQARILLINALNHISRREVKRGMELLKELKQYCIYDDDKAAWIFFVGLCYEMGGAKAQMLQWYADAGQYNHRFYLPYIKLAKAAHGDGELEKAARYYQTGIECLLEEDQPDGMILGSTYANLASCYTMLHRYADAEQAMLRAFSYPLQPGAYATAAILYAAMGQGAKTAEYLAQLKSTAPAAVPQIQAMTRQILDGTHPSFPRDEKH